nr:MAG TPA: minor tail protein [Caudoviricetes sp.]
MAELNLALTLKARDQASRVFQRAQSQIKQSTKAMASARETLGVRSEHKIQQEINHTIAAYNRLKRSGTATSRELARAAEATRSKIAGLNAEMGKTTWGQRLNAAAGKAMAIGGAVYGVASTLKPAMDDKKQWDQNVAQVALTAFNDKDVDYIRTTGVARINKAAYDTTKNVGGNTDMALSALDGMIKNGLSFEQAEATLPTAQKMMIAGQASGDQVGSLLKVLSDYGFKGDELQKALEVTLQSGFDGKFEVSDMIQHLPNLLATSKNNGFHGLEDYKYLLSMTQVAANQSGSNDTAANNVANYLNKLNSNDTIERLKKVDISNKKGLQGIDLAKSYQRGLAAGNNPSKVMVDIAETLLKSDQEYVRLQKKLLATKDEQKKEIIKAQLEQKKGAVLGKLLPDVQAKAGFNAVTTKGEMDKYQSNLEDNKLGQNMDKSVVILAGTDLAKAEQAKSLNKFSQGEVSGWLNGIERKINDEVISAHQNGNGQAVGNLGLAMDVGKSALGYGFGGWALGKGISGGLGGVGAGSATVGSLGLSVAQGLKTVGKIGFAGAIADLSTSPQLDSESQKTLDLQHKVQHGLASNEEKKQFNDRVSESREQAKLFDALRNTDGGIGSFFTRKGVELSSLKYLESRLEKGDISDDIRKQIEERKARYEKEESERPYFTLDGKPKFQSVQTIGYSGLSVAANDTDSALSRTLGDLSGLANYQADFQHFGQTISDGLKTAIESQNFTIQNQIKIDMDGRPVYEGVAENIYQSMKRG